MKLIAFPQNLFFNILKYFFFQIIVKVENQSNHPNYWMPLKWACSVAKRARKENRIKNDHLFTELINQVFDSNHRLTRVENPRGKGIGFFFQTLWIVVSQSMILKKIFCVLYNIYINKFWGKFPGDPCFSQGKFGQKQLKNIIFKNTLQIDKFRARAGALLNYDWVPVPLVYTQVRHPHLDQDPKIQIKLLFEFTQKCQVNR